MKKTAKLTVTGLLSGFTNGLFGSGGGLFLVPLLSRWIKLDAKKAFACSVAVMLPVSLVSAAVYFFRGAIDFSSALPYMLGGALGGFISGKIFKRTSLGFVKKAFALLIIYGGLRALFRA